MSGYFKRMSVLARRPQDERSYFARRWRRHGDLVARLPGLRSYVQSHVLGGRDVAGFRVDGFVELWFDSAQAMAEAFASEAVKALIADEPGFPGHATGYTIAGRSLPPAIAVDRLIGVESPAFPQLPDGDNLTLLGVDIVEEILPKPGQSQPPQPVTAFRHYLSDMPVALECGTMIYPVASCRLA